MNSKVLFVVFLSCFVGALSLDLCSKSCPLNEVFSECKGGGTCQQTCSTRNTTVEECACVSGCICKPEFIRDANTYKCIKISSCPPIESSTCAKNEVYSKCGATGCQKNCNTINEQVNIKCACVAGCICRDGYIRSPITNQCILITSCDKCPSGYYLDSKSKRCELNCDICRDSKAEFKACGDRCRELTCENPLLEGIECPDDAQCEPGCFCKAGYIKDPKTQLCIRPKSCPNPCEDQNAVYSNCGSTCNIKTCRFPNGQGDDCMSTCEKGCFCKPGYVKNDSGKCVRPRNCPVPNCKRIDPNSELTKCFSICSEPTCKNPRGLSCLPTCQVGCICKKGFFRHSNGKCVAKCTECPYDQTYRCGFPACEKTCSDTNKTCDIVNTKCIEKCYCNEGFFRNVIRGNECTELEDCPIDVPPPTECADPNAEYTICGSKCNQPKCSSVGLAFMCLHKCEVGCFCKKGFFLDSKGMCVAKCTECPANEIMDCRNPTCLNEGCELNGIALACQNVPCVTKCYCAPGFVRINGVCAPKEKCPIVDPPPTECADPNAEYTKCGSICRQPTCRNPLGGSCWGNICDAGCFCKKGFFRHSNGKCVAECTECPRDQSYRCGFPACEKTCSDTNKTCDIVNIKCEEKCYCNEGFFRDVIRGNQCTELEDCPIDDPPPTACSDPNAEYTICGSKCNQPKCSSVGLTFMCLHKCEVGCFCKKGFFLDSKGMCVAKCTECPANEIMDCRNPTCLNEGCELNGIALACQNVPCVTKCYCAPGFVRINGVCAPKEKCPIVDPPPTECADPNAEYTKCGSICRQPTCRNPLGGSCWGNICDAGCFCKKGFFRHSNGKCVAKCTECPRDQSYRCGFPACEKTCSDTNKTCDIVNIKCEEKCYCNEGFFRDVIRGNQCTELEDCPNEV